MKLPLFPALLIAGLLYSAPFALAGPLRAGTARVEITDYKAGPVNDPAYAKALVLQNDETTVVIATLDAVSIGEIGRIPNDFLARVRSQLQKDLGLAPEHVLVNASHCHAIVRADCAPLVAQAIETAYKNLVPVKAGAGSGQEDGISENRRLRMKDGSEMDMRRAYAMPRDEEIAGVGPIDPQIGVLRLDRTDGTPFAVLYEFACHPIMGAPSGGSSADYPGYASKVIEESLGHGAMAFFVQGCAGDIDPVRYKEVWEPHDAERLGNKLGLSTMRAVRSIECREPAALTVINGKLKLPRAKDYETRIAANQSEQAKLLQQLRPCNVNFKTFLPLFLGERLWPDYPSHYAQSYLHDKALGRDDLPKLDATNRADVETYLNNIRIMERLTQLSTNQVLLKKHFVQSREANDADLEVEVAGLRLGDFRMITFPGELTVEIGLRIKKAANDPHLVVAGYTNGYIFYTPTVEQRRNTGFAQEDCDSLVAPEWQKLFEDRAGEVIKQLTGAVK